MKGIEETEAAVQKSRSKGPKLLFLAWESGRSKDPGAFVKGLTEAVKHFDKTMEEPHAPDSYVSLPHSIVLAATRRLGVNVPPLEPRLQARLLTQESVGLRR